MDPHSIRVSVGKAASGKAPSETGRPIVAAAEPNVSFTPPIDIYESPDGLALEADLPGATEENLTIQLEDNVLSLHARIVSTLPEGARPLHEEYRVGDFSRSFILSDEVDRSRITAELKHGVLRLLLPKAERSKTRRIEIKAPSA